MFSDYVDGLREIGEGMMEDTLVAYEPYPDADRAEDGMESLEYTAKQVTPGKIQGASRGSDTNARSVNVGGVDQPVVQGGLHIPVASLAPVAGSVGVGWEYEVTAIGPATPADLLGSRWLVVDSPAKSYMTARRLDVVRLL